MGSSAQASYLEGGDTCQKKLFLGLTAVSWQITPDLSGCSVVANAKQRKTPAAAKHSVLASKCAAAARGRGRGRGRVSDRSASVDTYTSMSDDDREVGSRVVEQAASGGKSSHESSGEATLSESVAGPGSESGAGASSGLASGSAKVPGAGAYSGDSDAPRPFKRTRPSGNKQRPVDESLGPDACSERAAFLQRELRTKLPWWYFA